ncbi:TolB-like 6-bladed beta-propeller domain-containing protein [Parabacteroides sp. OttesenSCG-928-J18]|nr:TolB-like 6-bladed beta-propeller domain-containing protein [Parabacteroides sp. OttesenSCG-928-J18]
MFASCDTKHKEFSPPVFNKQINVKYSVVQDTFLLKSPREIISFDNYIVINVLTDNNNLHVYDKQTGDYLGGYVTRGQGPEEIATWCESLDYNKNEKKVTLLEVNTNQCFIFTVNDDPENLLTFDSKKDFTENSKEGIERPSNLFIIDENLYLLDSRVYPPSENHNRRFSLRTEAGEKTSEYNDFSTDDFWAYTGASQRVSVSPNRMKLAHATFYGAVLETFKIGNTIDFIQEKLFYPIILEDKNNMSSIPTDETIQGFLDICTSDEYIFSILIGSKESNNKNISVFDWNGNPVIRFNTDIDLYNICYNKEDNSIYAVAMTEDYDYMLVKFDISNHLAPS